MNRFCDLKDQPQRLAWLIVMLFFVMGTVVAVAPASAATGDALQGARDCTRRLYRSKKRMKYRDHWLRCIQGYGTYYRKYPNGRQADEALYATAKLYKGLYGYSRRSGDLSEATNRYRRVVEKFPQSRFADDAQYQVGEIYRKYKKDLERAYVEYFKVVIDFPQGDMKPRAQKRLKQLEAKMGKGKPKADLPRLQAATGYALQGARDCTRRLYRSKKRMKYRDQWLRCIQGYETYYRKYPNGRQADEALYTTAKLYNGLYGYSRVSSDLTEATNRYRRVVERFPQSRFADDAQYQVGEIYRKYKKDLERAYVEYFKVVIDFPQGDMKPRAQKRLKQLEAKMGKGKPKADLPRLPKVAAVASSSLARVTDIRHWSAQDYTRVVIDVNDQVKFASHLLRPDPDLKKPRRLYIDLKSSALDPEFPGAIPIGDGLLRKVRAGQYKPKVVRVVLDIETIEDYKIFSLSDPFRIVIDVTGESRKQLPAPGKGGAPGLTLAQQLGLGVKRVVIDPGHGGKDPGAVGPGGVREKDVVLAIARKLQEKLSKQLKLEAILTRRSDRFLPLEERTALANTKKADLFVSIHTNAHKNRRIQGISTYILNVATDAEAARVAAFENAVSTKRISDLEKILNDLMLNSKINESSRLADVVQRGLTNILPKKYKGIKDLGVKQAPFYVLIGAQMPSIMVEASFITNKREAKRLANPAYQNALAEGILVGIRTYIRQIESVPERG